MIPQFEVSLLSLTTTNMHLPSSPRNRGPLTTCRDLPPNCWPTTKRGPRLIHRSVEWKKSPWHIPTDFDPPMSRHPLLPPGKLLQASPGRQFVLCLRSSGIAPGDNSISRHSTTLPSSLVCTHFLFPKAQRPIAEIPPELCCLLRIPNPHRLKFEASTIRKTTKYNPENQPQAHLKFNASFSRDVLQNFAAGNLEMRSLDPENTLRGTLETCYEYPPSVVLLLFKCVAGTFQIRVGAYFGN